MAAHVRTVVVAETDRRELKRRARSKGAPAPVVERARHRLERPLPAVHLDQGPRHRHRQGHRPTPPEDTDDVRYGALVTGIRVTAMSEPMTYIGGAGERP
jgi:hypothetical protein